MSLDEMAEILSEEIDAVIDHPILFKNKLQIGEEAYRYLSNAKNLKNFFEITGVGVAAGGIAAFGWFSSLGFIGQIGLSVGLVTTPVGWIAAAGAGGAGLAYGVKRLFKKAEKATMDNVPKFINTPLDALALNISQILLPPSLKIACADSRFCDKENDCIRAYFTDQWGYNQGFIQKEIDMLIDRLSEIDLQLYGKQVSELCEKNKELKYDRIKDEILSLTKEVVSADGQIHPMETRMHSELTKAL